MRIIETQDYYIVSFFPDAEEVEIDDKTAEKGYKAVLGIQDGQHVVMKVMYAKDRHPLDDEDKRLRGFPSDAKTVEWYASNIGECEICKRLDANVAQLTEVRRLNQVPVRAEYQLPFVAQPAPVAPAAVHIKSTLFDTGNPLQDLLMQMQYTTKLNQTGQVATALALGDPLLLKEAMPTSIDGVLELIGNLTELSQGKGDIYRSPDEVTKYIKAMRAGVSQPVDSKTEEKTEMPVFRRASRIIIG